MDLPLEQKRSVVATRGAQTPEQRVLTDATQTGARSVGVVYGRQGERGTIDLASNLQTKE
jgi:hypothetical protein